MVHSGSWQSNKIENFLELVSKLKYEFEKEIDAHKKERGKDGNINQLKNHEGN